MATGWWVANTVTPSPFVFTLTMGTPVIEKTEDVNVTPAGFDLTLGWGTPVNGLSVSPAPLDLTLDWGTPVVIRDEVATPAGMNLTLAGGTPDVISTAHQFPTPAGVNLGLTWGTPVVTIVPPVAYNAVGPGVYGYGSVSDFSFTAAAGADVFVVVANDRSAVPSGGVTYGGVAMTQVASAIHNNTSAYGGVTVYRLAGAGTGASKTVTVASGSGWLAANAISFTGVHATVTAATNTGTGTLASQTVSLTSPVGLQIFSGGNAGGTTAAFGSFTGVTNRYNTVNAGSALTINTVSASGTVSASTNNPWAAVFINL
ncbi:minor tail protein [Mycobacterium phage Barbarian]|nr:minor tail protein [Mycobacterium phage Barbarian]